METSIVEIVVLHVVEYAARSQGQTLSGFIRDALFTHIDEVLGDVEDDLHDRRLHRPHR